MCGKSDIRTRIFRLPIVSLLLSCTNTGYPDVFLSTAIFLPWALLSNPVDFLLIHFGDIPAMRASGPEGPATRLIIIFPFPPANSSHIPHFIVDGIRCAHRIIGPSCRNFDIRHSAFDIRIVLFSSAWRPAR